MSDDVKMPDRSMVQASWCSIHDALFPSAAIRCNGWNGGQERLDVERMAQTGVNVWGWDISRARQYAEQFVAEYARLEREGWYRGPEAKPFA